MQKLRGIFSSGHVFALANAATMAGSRQVNTVVPAPQTHPEAPRPPGEAIETTRELRWRTGALNTRAYLTLMILLNQCAPLVLCR